MEVLRTNSALGAVRSLAVGFFRQDTDNARRVRARPWRTLQASKDDRTERNSEEWALGFSGEHFSQLATEANPSVTVRLEPTLIRSELSLIIPHVGHWSPSQPDVKDLRDRQEMGVLCRRQSRHRGRAAGKESGSGKAYSSPRTNPLTTGCARRARPHDGFSRSADRLKSGRDIGFALEGCRFSLRRDSRRTGLLSRSDRHTKNQGQPQRSARQSKIFRIW